jgi:hypothetical protein
MLENDGEALPVSVGVICDSWPLGGFAAQAAGLDLHWCCGTTKIAKQMIRWAGFPWARQDQLSPVDIVLVPAMRRSYLNWVGCSCRVLLAGGSQFRRSRFKPRPNLQISYTKITHSAVGGVSSADVWFMVVTCCPRLHQRVRTLRLPLYPTTNLGSILNCTLDVGRPTQRVPSPPGSVVLGSGLYPLGLGSDHVVCSPCVHWPRFRLRSLDNKEYADVLDMPSSFYLELKHRQALGGVSSLVQPLKPYSVFLQHIFMFRPGGLRS